MGPHPQPQISLARIFCLESPTEILTKENLVTRKTVPTAIFRTFTPLLRRIGFPYLGFSFLSHIRMANQQTWGLGVESILMFTALPMADPRINVHFNHPNSARLVARGLLSQLVCLDLLSPHNSAVLNPVHYRSKHSCLRMWPSCRAGSTVLFKHPECLLR